MVRKKRTAWLHAFRALPAATGPHDYAGKVALPSSVQRPELLGAGWVQAHTFRRGPQKQLTPDASTQHQRQTPET